VTIRNDSMGNDMSARLVDVAKLAGVAPSTVSYVLSGNRPISDETRERVEKAIKELGFRPHAGARSIRRESLNVIAMVLPVVADGQNDVLMQFVLAVLKAARIRGANVLLLTAEDSVGEITRVMASAQIDGVIVMELQEHDPRIPVLKSMSPPAVLIGTPPNPDDLVHVDFDFRAAGAACVDYLFEGGHRRIGYLGHPAAVYQRETRYAVRALDGARDQMVSLGIAPLWSPMEVDGAAAGRAIDTMLEQDPEITGLIVYNERMLPLVMDRLKQLGRDVPGDISVVAICPTSDATQIVPSIAHVPLPVSQLAELAFDRLIGLIDGDDKPFSTLLPPRIQGAASARALTQ
jgi:DNA-binding LacI/PurR family transcriptional regulator